MITKYLRELLKPIINDCMYENEASISNRYIADMKSINKDLYDIRMRLSELTDIDYAGDIADNISAYEIASHIDMSYAIDTDAFARDISNNLDIASEFQTVNDKIDAIEKLLKDKFGIED